MKSIRRYELVSTAAIALAVALALVLMAFVLAAFTRSPSAGAVIATVAVFAIAASGLLYASRLGAGGPED
jgi:hypothetical protein